MCVCVDLKAIRLYGIYLIDSVAYLWSSFEMGNLSEPAFRQAKHDSVLHRNVIRGSRRRFRTLLNFRRPKLANRFLKVHADLDDCF